MIKKPLDIEQLVIWALLDQRMGWRTGDGHAGPARLTAMDYGTRIDVSSRSGYKHSTGVHEDAVVVRNMIDELPEDVAGLVIRYGRTASRPDWCEEGEGEWRQKVAGNGRLAFEYERAGDRTSAKVPVMEFIGWRPTEVAYFRAEYRLWWTALDEIIKPLNERLEEHIAKPSWVKKEPWLGWSLHPQSL